jgi:hypothetical protein
MIGGIMNYLSGVIVGVLGMAFIVVLEMAIRTPKPKGGWPKPGK